jgi:hypothetical protein
MPKYDKKDIFAHLCLDVFTTFRDVTTIEQRKSIVAKARGLAHSHASHIANLVDITDSRESLKSDGSISILQGSFAFFMREIAVDIKKYVNLYGFKPKNPDPLKITYFFVLYFYKHKLIEDMELLKKMMFNVLSANQCPLDSPENKDALHLFIKGIVHSSGGYENFENLYGKYGFYKIYKLTYRLLKCQSKY